MAKPAGRGKIHKGTLKGFKVPAIPEKVFFRIGEVARLLGVKAHVLRYWETEFPMFAPAKTAKNHRVYRRSEVEAFFKVRHLLYEEKYSIEGARRRLKAVAARSGLGGDPEKLARLQALTEALGKLARTPITRLFHL